MTSHNEVKYRAKIDLCIQLNEDTVRIIIISSHN